VTRILRAHFAYVCHRALGQTNRSRKSSAVSTLDLWVDALKMGSGTNSAERPLGHLAIGS